MKKTSKHKYDNSDRQLSFDDLPMGETIPVPMENKGIGGELLNILSKGLYTNPLMQSGSMFKTPLMQMLRRFKSRLQEIQYG